MPGSRGSTTPGSGSRARPSSSRATGPARPRVGPLLPFHLAFALFRFAVIFVGIADRARAGTAAGRNAASIGPLASRFATLALDIIVRQRVD